MPHHAPDQPCPAPTCAHACCARIPAWTARVGQPWRPYPDAPWNLYNAPWRAQHTWLTLREHAARTTRRGQRGGRG
ncbi:hypothetical protein GCM10028781_28560 [Nostocoides australiense]